MTENMSSKRESHLVVLLLDNECFTRLSPLTLSEWNYLPRFSQWLHLVWTLIDHWLPGDAGPWGQEEAQGPTQRDEWVVPGPQGLAVWSRPAKEIYLAGSDAAGCIMTPDCAISKQTRMAWLWLALLPPPSPQLAGRARTVRGGGEQWLGRGLLRRGLISLPQVCFLSFSLLPFFAHPLQHGRAWAAQRALPFSSASSLCSLSASTPVDLICPQSSAKWVEFIHLVIHLSQLIYPFICLANICECLR